MESGSHSKVIRFSIIVAAFVLGSCANQASANIIFETEISSMNLTGGPFLMPLASDPANWLGDSVDGFGFVESGVLISMSSQRPFNPGPLSTGQTTAWPDGQGGPNQQLEIIDPEALHGQLFQVDSFFDVFVDMTFMDVDPRPGRDYAGMPDGATLSFLDIGPASINASYQATFDKDDANFGLLPPPTGVPYVGFFFTELYLGGDINGNGEDDKIKFDISLMYIGDGFTTAEFYGVVVDITTDPPFIIGGSAGAFGGPTTASSTLQNPVIPVPGALVLGGIGVGFVTLLRRRRTL